MQSDHPHSMDMDFLPSYQSRGLSTVSVEQQSFHRMHTEAKETSVEFFSSIIQSLLEPNRPDRWKNKMHVELIFVKKMVSVICHSSGGWKEVKAKMAAPISWVMWLHIWKELPLFCSSLQSVL